MTRFSAAILIGLALCMAGAGRARDFGPTDRCFPWQEFQNGICVARSAPDTSAQRTAAPESNTPPVPAETSAAPPPLACPPNSHVEGGTCIVDVTPPPTLPRAPITVTCNGGSASGGQCTCPAGFRLIPAGADTGGTCVRSNADNCLGGQMTVAGECLCIGQVTMSGQVYDLEFARGKCVPKRCPRDASCVTAAASPDVDTSSKLPSDAWPRDCGHGTVATRHGCEPTRRRSHADDLKSYFRIWPSDPSRIRF
jgi:hypothetical protein